MNHFMFDIETLGPAPKGHILSIGVQQFDPHQARLGDTFHAVLGFQMQEGRHVDLETVEWWMKQSEAAREGIRAPASVVPSPHMLAQTILDLDEWLRSRGVRPGNEEVRCWAKPPSFDIEILRDAWQIPGAPWPFHWRCTRDVRTLLDVAKLCKVELQERPENGGQHNALGDAIWQAQRVIDIVQALRQQGNDARGIEWRRDKGVGAHLEGL